jgi:hypothetical protein
MGERSPTTQEVDPRDPINGLEPDERGPVARHLEPIEVVSEPASVVVSVRLDNETARRLAKAARDRGVRLSDVLREAARAYAEHEPVKYRPSMYVQGGAYVVVGSREWTSEPHDQPRGTPRTIPWSGRISNIQSR